MARTSPIRERGEFRTWNSEYVWLQFLCVADIWLDSYSLRLYILTQRNKGLVRAALWCLIIWRNLHFNAALCWVSHTTSSPMSYPPLDFLQCKVELMSLWVWAGCREKGRREGKHRHSIRGKRFIDILLRIYSLRILFILFMFINHILASTMKSSKSPVGYLAFSVIGKRQRGAKCEGMGGAGGQECCSFWRRHLPENSRCHFSCFVSASAIQIIFPVPPPLSSPREFLVR